MFPCSHSHRRWLPLGYYWNVLELAEFYMFMMFHSPTWRLRRLSPYRPTRGRSIWMGCFRASKAGVSGSASSYLASFMVDGGVVQRTTILATKSGIEWINDTRKSLVVPKVLVNLGSCAQVGRKWVNSQTSFLSCCHLDSCICSCYFLEWGRTPNALLEWVATLL